MSVLAKADETVTLLRRAKAAYDRTLRGAARRFAGDEIDSARAAVPPTDASDTRRAPQNYLRLKKRALEDAISATKARYTELKERHNEDEAAFYRRYAAFIQASEQIKQRYEEQKMEYADFMSVYPFHDRAKEYSAMAFGRKHKRAKMSVHSFHRPRANRRRVVIE